MKNFNAIRFLYPEAVFSMVNDDPNQITWVGQEFPIPTGGQLADAITAMEAEEAAKVTAKAAAKESAQAKLTALGLSGEEIAALTNN
jgi:hypothetical protein